MFDLTALFPIPWRREPSARKQRPELSRLPAEILQLISDFLPISSAASFALCSRRFLWLLGDRAFTCLKSPDHAMEKKALLMLLEKSLPDWLLCHSCIRFHPVAHHDGPESPWTFAKPRECAKATGAVYINSRYRLYYRHVQLLMNQYRFGRAYQRALEGLSHNSIKTLGGINIKTEISARIILGELLLQVVSTVEMPSSSDIDLVMGKIPEICPHQRDSVHWKYVLRPQMTLCPLCHAGGNSPCITCNEQNSCQECPTWYQVHREELGTRSTEIQIVIWKYLGSCETPFDAKWRRQIDILDFRDTLGLKVPGTSTRAWDPQSETVEVFSCTHM